MITHDVLQDNLQQIVLYLEMPEKVTAIDINIDMCRAMLVFNHFIKNFYDILK